MEEIQILNSKLAERSLSENLPKEAVQASEIFATQTLADNLKDSAAIITAISGSDDAPLSLRLYDAVQVYDPESSHWGVIFQVGDVRGSKVHGYYLQPKGEKVYVTFNINQLRLIGTSRVRSKACCSPKWVAEHNTPQQ